MKNYPNGGFPELFELIEDYAGGPEDRQAMALKVIGGRTCRRWRLVA